MSYLQQEHKICQFIFLVCILVASVTKLSAQSDSSVPGKLVWTADGLDFSTGDISSDGHFFTDINWSTGDIDLINLESGVIRPLTGEGYNDGGYTWMSSFSSDGMMLSYEWYNFAVGTHELRMYSFDGDSTRTVIPASPGRYYLEPLDWSPDDRHILIAVRELDGNWTLAILTVADGSLKELKSLGWQAPGGGHPQAYPSAEWSPDGQFIGYDYASEIPGNAWDIFALRVEDGSQNVLVEGPGDDRFLAWNATGTEILFYSDRSGNPSLWKRTVAGGVPIGEPQLVFEDIRGLDPIGQTEQGYAFGIPAGTNNVYIAEVDFATGEILKSPHPVDDITWHRNSLGDWSPEGDRLLYITFDPRPGSKERAVLVSTNGEIIHQVTFPENFHNKTGTVEWISDDMILLDGHTPKQSGIHVFHLRTGEVTLPTDFGEHGFFQRFKAHPDGSAIYVEIGGSMPRVVSMDTRTGTQKNILTGAIIPGSHAVSPGGDEIAYLIRTDTKGKVFLKTVNIHSGAIEIIHCHPAGILGRPVAWSADGQHILVGHSDEERQGLWSVPKNCSEKPVFIALPGVFGNSLRVNPDGRHIAFQGGDHMGAMYILDDF